ncbi:MAG: hypothetical protein B6D41_11155 [Chloroflexi bacterium UTCFX4]|jgi:rRNA maturation endonuclease Nob1|nr:MAG: hypothetical protein B6D41_11155 [Chloroflexi bacterium UTCFX4]
MDFAIALLILAATLVVLALPLYRTRRPSAALSVSTLDNLLAQRDSIYASLRDLELDRQLGKLDEADYNARRDQYMTQAAVALRQLDAAQGQGAAAEANAALEQEIRARRKTADRKTGRAKTAAGFCRNCGKAVDAGDKFCPKCGHALQ